METAQTTAPHQGNGVRMALEASADMDARKAARVSQLAKSLGMPEGFVVENPYLAEQKLRARQVEKNTAFAMWAEEGTMNSILGRDDTEPLLDVFDTVKHVFNRETAAIGRAWGKGEAQRRLSRLGNRYLSGDRSVLQEAEHLRKEMNPYADQEAFGIVRPGSLPFVSRPLKPAQAKEYPLDKPLQSELDALFADVRIASVEQELEDLFSAPPHIHTTGDGKAVLLPSLDENGRAISKDDAAARFFEDNMHAGIFSSADDAAVFLAQTPARQRELYGNWKEKPEESWIEAKLGPAGGIEQLPRLLQDQLPTQMHRSIQGALGGAGTAATAAVLFGQAGPQAATLEEVGTVPAAAVGGAIVGGRAMWVAGAAEASFEAERGAFALDLARERDANGQPLSDATILAASNVYASLAAGVEALGEAFFLTLLKPLGMGDAAQNLGKDGVRSLIRSTVRRTAFDRSTSSILLNTGLRLGLNATAEGIEETAQEALGILTEIAAKKYENLAKDKNFVGNELFTQENADRLKEAFQGGSVAGFWLGSGPIMVSSAIDLHDARQANAFAQKHLDVHAKVEATLTKQLSPEHMQSALEAASPAMLERVEIPAEAALELYQKGVDILTPLGITEQEATDAAGKGHSFLTPISRMHASLDQRQMEAAAQIMRRSSDSMNAQEAAHLDKDLAANASRMVELYQGQAEELAAFDTAVTKLRGQAIEAVNSVPGLKAQVKSLAGGAANYVDTWLKPLKGFALRMAATGQSPAEILKKLVVQGLNRSGNGEAGAIDYSGITEERMAAFGTMMAQGLTDEAVHESIVSKVRGRLDGKELERDYPDAYREITRLHGADLFSSEEHNGVPLESLAAELVDQNLLEHGSSADALLERLRMPEGRSLGHAEIQREGGPTIAPDNTIVNVVPVDTGTVPKFSSIAELRGWLKNYFSDRNPIIIYSTGAEVIFTTRGLKDSVKSNRVKKDEHRGVYGQLDKIIQEAVYAGFVAQDARHANVQGQDTYYSAMDIKGTPYAIRLRLDVPLHGGELNYKDHKVTEIDIAPIRNTTEPLGGQSTELGTISGIRLSVLKREVKPSGIEDGILFQYAGETSALSRATHIKPDKSGVLAGHGESIEAALTDLQRKEQGLDLHEHFPIVFGDTPAASLSLNGGYNFRGSISVRSDDYLINLFRKADLSTLLHETGHAFLEEIGVAMQSGIADAGMVADFKVLKNWFSRFDNEVSLKEEYDNSIKGSPSFSGRVFEELTAKEKVEVRTIAEKEYFARGFEAYLMEGKAPTQELASAFARFKKWLTAVYQNAKRLNVELNDDVRGVFDRMLSLEREIATSAARHELFDLTRKELDALGITGPERENADKLMPAAREAAARRIVQDRSRSRKDRLEQYPPAEYLVASEQASAQVAMVGKCLAQKLGKPPVQQEAIASLATKELASMPMGKAMQAGPFLAAMRRALRQQRQGIGTGEFAAALEANHKARLNMEFVRQSRDVFKAQEAVANLTKRFIGMSKADPDARYIVMDIAMRHTLAAYNEQLAEGRDMGTFQSWLTAVRAEGHTVQTDDTILFGVGKPWQEMTRTEFDALSKSIRQIVTIERNRRPAPHGGKGQNRRQS